MSKLAQAVQQQVEEMRRSAPKRRRGIIMDGDGEDPSQAHDVTETLAEPPADTSTTAEGEASMTKKKTTAAKKTAKKAKLKTAKKKAAGKASKRTKTSKKARTERKETTPGTRQHKQYTLVDGIPDKLRNPSSGRSILESIETRGQATADDIRADHPGYPDPTIRFYLGKFQRTGVLTGA